MMVDELGFKVGFPKRTKVNRWHRAFQLKAFCTNRRDEKLGHVSRRTIVKETQV